MKRRYDLFYALGLLVSSPVLAFGLLKTGKWRTDWKGRFGKTASLPEDPRPTLLIHGVSVGEINATRELVARLTAPDAPPLRLVVSATTNTGYARAQELYGDSLPVVRFPFDFSWMVGRFFDALRPDAVALMELELWPNLAQICQARGIPLSVLNGRLSDKSYKHYRWTRLFVRSMFRKLAAVGVQTEEYARRFESLGTPRDHITVTDTMKWDTVKLVDEVAGARELGEAMGIDPHRPLVVAGSTGPGEEALLLAGKPRGVQLMLVPRKPERFQEVARLAPGLVRRTERPDGGQVEDGGRGSGGELFLLDTMGELTKAFALAEVAVVGRSFVPLGGSDPIEAVALGKATVMGPHFDNFRDVVEALRGAGGIRISDTPWDGVRGLLDDAEAREEMGARGRGVIRERQGATEKNAGILRSLLERKRAGGFPPAPPGGRARRWVTTALALYLMAGYLTALFTRIPAQEGAPATLPLPAAGGEVWSGVLSVHTDRSHDARGTREQVATAAAAAGLDFVVVGDHPPDDRKPGWAFWEPVILDGVLIEGGQELRSPRAGKVLVVGVDTTYKQWQGDYASFVGMLDREDATAFVVHPRGPRGSERWVNPDVRGMNGWEVLDISEFARDRLVGPWGPYHALTLLLGTPLGLGDEAFLHLMREGFRTPAAVAYDSMRGAGPLTATAGLNTHPKLQLGPLLLPGYGSAFKTLVTHVVVERPGPGRPGAGTGGAATVATATAESTAPSSTVAISATAESAASSASAALMEGARAGNVHISAGSIEMARSFRMGVMTSQGSLALRMGGEIPFAPGLILRAGFEANPEKRLLYRILRNGGEEGWVRGDGLAWEITGPGVYRVEVYTYAGRVGDTYLHVRPWIFSNTLGIQESEARHTTRSGS